MRTARDLPRTRNAFAPRRQARLTRGLASLALWWAIAPAVAQDRPSDHYLRGIRLLEQELWDPAIYEFHEALKQAPDEAATHIAMGVALSNKGAADLAVGAFRNAAELQPESTEARFNLGLALRNAGLADQAIKELEQSIRLDPTLEQGRFELGLLLQGEGLWERSTEVFEQILERNPAAAMAHHWVGVAYQQREDFGKAIASFRSAIEIEPSLVRAHNSLGTLLAETGSMEAAVESFRTALELQPGSADIRMNLGVALRTVGEGEAAVRQFQEILAAGAVGFATEGPGPDFFAEVQHQVGQTLRGRDPAGAAEAYEKALELNPEKLESYYGLGQALKRLAARSRGGPQVRSAEVGAVRIARARSAASSGDLAAARSELEQALEAAPEFAPAHSLLGFVLGQQGDLEGSVQRLREAISLSPRFAEPRYHLGLALWYQGRRTEATAELEEALRLDPAMAEACAFLGMAYREQRRDDDARRYLQRAIALKREMPGPYVDLGVVFLRERRGDWALGQFEAALNLPRSAGAIPDLDVPITALRAELRRNPNSAQAHNVLGRLLGRAGADPQEVAKAFREAVRLRPEFPEALNNLGLVLTQTDRTEEALAAFREAVRIRPDFAQARANLGGALVIVDEDEAVRELEAALDINPGLVNAHYNLSRAHSQKADREREIKHLRKALSLDPGFAKAHLFLGRALVAERRIDEAVEHFERALELDPGLGEARYQLGLALVRVGRREEAQEHLRASRPLISERQQGETATVLMRQAREALGRGAAGEAVDKLRQVVSLAPGYLDAQLALGEALARIGEDKASAGTFRRALELRPDSYSAFLGLGRALQSAGRPEEAASAFRTAVKLRPSSTEALELEAQALLESGNEAGALESFREVTKLDPENQSAREQLGRIARLRQERRRTELLASLIEPGAPRLASPDILGTDMDDPAFVRMVESEMRAESYSQTETRLRQYLQDNPDSWWGHYALGYACFAQRKIGESVGALARSLRLNINNAEAHKMLGRTLMIIGRFDHARTEFEQAARLSPESAEIRYNLGKLHSAQDNFPAARREFERALRLDPSYMEAHNALGFALESMNANAEAVDSYRKSLAISEERAAAFISPYVNLAAHYNRLNDPSKALGYASEALEINPRSDLALFQAAKAFRALKQWSQAVDHLERAVSVNARVSRYHYVLGLLYRRLGEGSKSRESFGVFERLEKEATTLEAKRRAANADRQ